MPFSLVRATDDAFLYTSFATTNFGSSGVITQGGTGSNERIGLVKFDLTAIPTNASVSDARMYLTSFAGASGITHTVHRFVRAWVELQTTWNIAQTGTNWGTAGAKNATTDYDISLGTIAFPTTADESASISLATATVEGWISGSIANNGVRVSDASATVTNWHSSDASIKAFWPWIEVTYSIPTITYSVNSNVITAGILADWPPLIVGRNTDSTPLLSSWYRHIWRIAELDMADWIILKALRGTDLTELKTTDKDTPNVTKTYTTGRVTTVTGQQLGRRMIDVEIGYLVKV